MFLQKLIWFYVKYILVNLFILNYIYVKMIYVFGLDDKCNKIMFISIEYVIEDLYDDYFVQVRK